MIVTTENASGDKKKSTTYFTPTQYLSINFAGWGFYKIIKVSALKYQIIDKFENAVAYTITFSYR